MRSRYWATGRPAVGHTKHWLLKILFDSLFKRTALPLFICVSLHTQCSRTHPAASSGALLLLARVEAAALLLLVPGAVLVGVLVLIV